MKRGKLAKTKRREKAEELAKSRARRTSSEQLKRLDAGNYRAVKERRKLRS